MSFLAKNSPRCTRARRESLNDNPFLASALQSGKAGRASSRFTPRQAEQLGLYRGYYLRCSDGRVHWFGSTQAQARTNFEPAKARFVSKRQTDAFEVQFSAGGDVRAFTALAACTPFA